MYRNNMIELTKDRKVIGYLELIEDTQGGGLNGGVFFRKKDDNVLYADIPLFETYRII
jgi:hypothetical protein